MRRRFLNRITALALSAVVLLFSLCSCDDLSFLAGNITDGKLVCHYLDIGQGDSIFIELPNSKTMLIDSGENYHGAGIISYIKSTGHNRIDYLVGTHPHSDHIGSMAYIVRNFEIGEVYMPKVSTGSKVYEELLKALKNKKLTAKSGKAGVNIIDDSDKKLKADIIAPVKLDKENLNNSSVIIKMTFNRTSFLFTGDAEKAELASVKSDMSADVLKVGHHGSSTSTTKDFLNKVNPKIAVISCGAGNDYGHPHKNTLKLLKQADCEVHRTDREGTVSVTSDGKNYEVKSGLSSIARAK